MFLQTQAPIAEWVTLEKNLKTSKIFKWISLGNDPNSILNFYFNIVNPATDCTFEAYDGTVSKGYISNSKMGQIGPLNITSQRGTDTVFQKSDAYTFMTSYTQDNDTYYLWWIPDGGKDDEMSGNGEWEYVTKSALDQQLRMVFTQAISDDRDYFYITPIYYIGQDANDQEYLSFDDSTLEVTVVEESELDNKKWQISEWWDDDDIQLKFLSSSLLGSIDSVCKLGIGKHKDGTIYPTKESSKHCISHKFKIHSSYYKLHNKSHHKHRPCDYGNYFYISLNHDKKSYFLHHSNKHGSKLKFKEFEKHHKDKQLEKSPFYVRYPFPHLKERVGYICTKHDKSASGDQLYVHYDGTSNLFTLSNKEYTLFCM